MGGGAAAPPEPSPVQYRAPSSVPCAQFSTVRLQYRAPSSVPCAQFSTMRPVQYHAPISVLCA
eukprot:501608-Rhodomonas_salina.3